MQRSKRRQYTVLAGIGLLAIALLVLLISPSFIFSPTVTVIGSNLGKTSGDQVTVTTRTDFSDEAQMSAFPMDIGKWHGRDYDASATQEALNATVLLLRGYDPETFTQPLFLTIVQSKTTTSFHAPDYCFKSQGYGIQESGTEYINITDPEWTDHPAGVSIPLGKLVVTRDSSTGDLVERRLVLFFYVKGNQYYSDEITMIQVQGLVPLREDYTGTLSEAKDFVDQIFPLMFQPGTSVDSHPVIYSLAQLGWGGYVLIAVILLIPLTVIILALVRRREGAK